MSLWQLFSCGRNHAQVPFPEELSLRVMMDDLSVFAAVFCHFTSLAEVPNLHFYLLWWEERREYLPTATVIFSKLCILEILKPLLGKKVKYAETHTDTLLNILFQATVSVCLVGCLQNFYTKKTRQFVKLFCEFLSEISCLLLKLFSI